MISLLNDHELRQPGKERFLSWDQLNFTGCDVESLFFFKYSFGCFCGQKLYVKRPWTINLQENPSTNIFIVMKAATQTPTKADH